MASITIRKLDEKTKERLRVRAAQHWRSMEEEARTLLLLQSSVDRLEESFELLPEGSSHGSPGNFWNVDRKLSRPMFMR